MTLRLRLILFIALAALDGSAATGTDAFSAANKAYEKGQFAEAAALYETVITNGAPTGPAWFNLGNARFKAGELGYAIASWRMAEFSMPRDTALRANLAFARKKVNDSAAADRDSLDSITTYFTTSEWAVGACVLWTAFFGLLAVSEWRRVPARASLLAVLGGATLLLAATATRSYYTTFKQVDAVVVHPGVARFGPLEDSQISFQVADGAEFAVIDQTVGWVQVQDSRGKVGWIKKGDVFIVSPTRG